MERVVSFVTGAVAEDRLPGLRAGYEAVLAEGLPPAIVGTMLVQGESSVGIITIWRSRDDLAVMRASGEEPVARRLIRQAGGTPSLQLFDVLAMAIEADGGPPSR